jgi:hypothetical protein
LAPLDVRACANAADAYADEAAAINKTAIFFIRCPLQRRVGLRYPQPADK